MFMEVLATPLMISQVAKISTRVKAYIMGSFI